MTKHTTGTREEWLAARLKLLEAEKDLTRRSDELARQRQELPWVIGTSASGLFQPSTYKRVWDTPTFQPTANVVAMRVAYPQRRLRRTSSNANR